MEHLIATMNPDLLVYAGAGGLFLGFLFLLLFVYRRVRWLISLLGRNRAGAPELLASLRNFLLILVWTSIFGMLCFFGFFLGTYHAFTYEKPIAEIAVEPATEPGTVEVTLTEFAPPLKRQYLIRGEQWMIEGDILKWKNWLQLWGLHNRYRLTRLRGRHSQVAAELREKPTVYKLVEKEGDPLWALLYEYGHQLPFVSTAYGSAVFQSAGKNKRFLIAISPAGFTVRPK
jgi:hypothetical protein